MLNGPGAAVKLIGSLQARRPRSVCQVAAPLGLTAAPHGAVMPLLSRRPP